MNKKKRSTIFGAALIIFGVLLGVMLGEKALPERPQQNNLHRLPQGELVSPTRNTTSAQQTLPAGPVPPVEICFTDADEARVALRYGDGCNYRPDGKALLQQEMNWDLMGDEPTVLIVHTHGSESYTPTPGQDYTQTTQYRTLDTHYNVVALGDELAKQLEAAGIRVLHDRSIHDYPSFNSAYNNSRAAVQDYLRRYPSIQVVLDLHRDAVLNSDGTQFAPTVVVDGQKVAKLMLVVGTDDSGMYHPNWRENLSAAIKMQVLLERQLPGITRPTILRAQRFNHDLSPGAMIVEIGTAGNTLQEAMAAVPYLTRALRWLCRGTTANSTT